MDVNRKEEDNMMVKCCDNCIYSLPYCELDDNLEFIPDKQFLVCMITDTEVEPNETCQDYIHKEEE